MGDETTKPHPSARAERPEERAVRCAGLTHVYGTPGSSRSVTALQDVDLEIDHGAVVGLAGPSGSGKSTALSVLGGLLVPSAGTVEVLGTDLTDRTAGERARFRRDRVGFVFQGFHLLPSLTARSNVALPLVQTGMRRAERRRRADALLEAVGIADRASHRPGALSGGEQQRVAIARALVTEPELVLADEPTGELDTETGGSVLDLLLETAGNRTVIVASHDERALARADRVIQLRDGAVVDDGR